MKTVLVPGAPWPKVEPYVPKPKPKKKAKPKNTDDNFIKWLATEKFMK